MFKLNKTLQRLLQVADTKYFGSVTSNNRCCVLMSYMQLITKHCKKNMNYMNDDDDDDDTCVPQQAMDHFHQTQTLCALT